MKPENEAIVKLRLQDLAKSSCKHCHGRGYQGLTDKGYLWVCNCVLRRGTKEELTELRELSNAV